MIEKLLIAQGVGMAVAVALIGKRPSRPLEYFACGFAITVWPIAFVAFGLGVRDRIRRHRQFLKAKPRILPQIEPQRHPGWYVPDDKQ